MPSDLSKSMVVSPLLVMEGWKYRSNLSIIFGYQAIIQAFGLLFVRCAGRDLLPVSYSDLGAMDL